MSTATRELLATTGLLFDTSDAIFVELKRTVKAAEHSIHASGASALATTTTLESYSSAPPPAAIPTASADLARATSACTDSISQLKDLGEARSQLAEHRAEALEQAAQADAAERQSFLQDVAARRRRIDEEYGAKVQAIMAAHGLAAPAAAAPPTAAGSAESTAAVPQAAPIAPSL